MLLILCMNRDERGERRDESVYVREREKEREREREREGGEG